MELAIDSFCEVITFDYENLALNQSLFEKLATNLVTDLCKSRKQ